MYKSLLAYVRYAPTMLTAMIPADIHTKVKSIFDSCNSKPASKYLNGEKYLRNSRFSFSPEMMDMK
jgi:hypothetical protein